MPGRTSGPVATIPCVAGLTSQQTQVAQGFARALGAHPSPYIVQKALYEAGLTEAGLTDPNYGDRDSLGALQQRASWGPAASRLNPEQSAARFIQKANALVQAGFKGSSGELAQAVQQSAFPGRYITHGGEAASLVNSFVGGTGSSDPSAILNAAAAGGSAVLPSSSTDQDSAAANVAVLTQLLGQQRASPAASALRAPAFAAAAPTPAGAATVQQTGAPAAPASSNIDALLALVQPSSDPGSGSTTAASTAPASSAASAAPTAHGGVTSFGGTPVANWIAPILSYARSKGWKGAVTSGYRSKAEQTQIYDSGVRPAAKPGTSNHEFTVYPGGAVDVSDAPQLSQILQGSPYAKALVWAGSKDPVHFSHPSANGSY